MQHNCFKLLIRDPAVLKRTGKMDILLDVSSKIENGLEIASEYFLLLAAYYVTNPSYIRPNNFNFPIVIKIELEKKMEVVKEINIMVWKHDEDNRYLVMIDFKNNPECNFEGDHEETLDWILERVKRKIA